MVGKMKPESGWPSATVLGQNRLVFCAKRERDEVNINMDQKPDSKAVTRWLAPMDRWQANLFAQRPSQGCLQIILFRLPPRALSELKKAVHILQSIPRVVLSWNRNCVLARAFCKFEEKILFLKKIIFQSCSENKPGAFSADRSVR